MGIINAEGCLALSLPGCSLLSQGSDSDFAVLCFGISLVCLPEVQIVGAGGLPSTVKEASVSLQEPFCVCLPLKGSADDTHSSSIRSNLLECFKEQNEGCHPFSSLQQCLSVDTLLQMD